MKPQDRTRAILRSGLEPGLGWALIAIADHMSSADVTWIKPEAVVEETGCPRSTFLRSFATLLGLGILTRAPGEHPSPDLRIDWSRLEAYRRAPSRRGGSKPRRPIMGLDRLVGQSHNGTAGVPSWDKSSPIMGQDQSHYGIDSSHYGTESESDFAGSSASGLGFHEPVFVRSAQEATTEAISEATSEAPTRPADLDLDDRPSDYPTPSIDPDALRAFLDEGIESTQDERGDRDPIEDPHLASSVETPPVPPTPPPEPPCPTSPPPTAPAASAAPDATARAASTATASSATSPRAPTAPAGGAATASPSAPAPTAAPSSSPSATATTSASRPTATPEPPTTARGAASPPGSPSLFGSSPTPTPKPTADPAPMPWAKTSGGEPAAIEALVLGVLAVVRGKPVNPSRCGTDAKEILGLWRALDKPPPAELQAELMLVAEWARFSADRAAARDIRAEGWEGGTDRSRSLGTLCRRDRWGDRLAAAQAWDRKGRPGEPGRVQPIQGRPATANPRRVVLDDTDTAPRWSFRDRMEIRP